MRKREKTIIIRLTKDEMEKLNQDVAGTALTREVYLRTLISGYQPIERPATDTIALLQELRKIGINMNQIAYKANALNLIDKEAYFKSIMEIQSLIINFMKSTMSPKPFEHGNDRDLED